MELQEEWTPDSSSETPITCGGAKSATEFRSYHVLVRSISGVRTDKQARKTTIFYWTLLYKKENTMKISI